MSIQNANKELKAKKLPIAFHPTNAPSGVYAINTDLNGMYRAIAVMRSHGYSRTETFDSPSADFQVCFERARH